MEWNIVLTKGDRLNSISLAQSIAAISMDLQDLHLLPVYLECSSTSLYCNDSKRPIGERSYGIFPVSASTGAGIRNLWLELKQAALNSTIETVGGQDTQETAVREHRNAHLLRKEFGSIRNVSGKQESMSLSMRSVRKSKLIR